MLKGKSVIELTDVHTGKKECYEDTNLVTEAAMDVLNCNIKGILYNNTTFNGSNGDDWMLPLKKNIMGGILLYQNALEERADNIYAPLNNPLIGYASDDANNTEDIKPNQCGSVCVVVSKRREQCGGTEFKLYAFQRVLGASAGFFRFIGGSGRIFRWGIGSSCGCFCRSRRLSASCHCHSC